MTSRLLVEKATSVRTQILELLRTAQQGKILREGLATDHRSTECREIEFVKPFD